MLCESSHRSPLFCPSEEYRLAAQESSALRDSFLSQKEAAAAGISECEGIDWESHQLMDILLPALSAMDTYTADEGVFEVRWLRHDTARGRWYSALSAAMADVVEDAARIPCSYFRAICATITRKVLEYIRKSLHVRYLVHLYKKDTGTGPKLVLWFRK